MKKKDNCFEFLKNNKKFMTATAVQIQRDAKNKLYMDYLMAKALLTGQIDSKVIKWAEEIVYVYEKLLKK
jgi:hypothetical protein